MDIISLPDFVSFLNSQKPEDFRGDKIDSYLSSNRLEQDDFIPFIYFREETYCRNLVFKNDNFELLVLTWLPHQKTPVHDNAGQKCWVLVQSGTLTLSHYDAPTANVPQLLGEPQLKRAGDIIKIEKDAPFYSLANATSKPAVSVHLYAGPVPQCRVYNENLQDVEWSHLNYFNSLALEP